MIEYAWICHFYKTSTIKISRLIIFIILLWLVFLTASNIPAFFLSIFLMWEVFFRFKIERLSPPLLIKDNNGRNILDSLTIESLGMFLASPTSIDLTRTFLHKSDIKLLLQKADISLNEVGLIEISKDSLMSFSFETAKKLGGKYVTAIDIFASYILLTEDKTKLLFNKKLKKEEFLDIVYWARSSVSAKETISPIKVNFWGEGVVDSWASGWTIETQKYMVDIISQSLKKKPMILGRTEEYNEIVSALSSNKSVVLVGEPGSGKDALIEALSFESFLGNVKGKLYHQRFYELLVDTLLAGTGNQGELESRLDDVIAEISHSGQVIIFIPKIENILGSTSFNTDLSGTLIPYLQKGNIRIIGTVTPNSYKKFIEPKHTFVDTLEVVRLRDLDASSYLRMLLQKVPEIEREKNIRISYRAVITACNFAGKYAPDRVMPGQAVLLLEDTASMLSVSKKKIMEEQDVIDRIENKTKIAVGIPKAKEKELLLHLEDELHKHIVDQKEAVFGVSEALRRLRAGLGAKEKPISFLFLGPTGVGKTETAKTLSKLYFKDEKNMLRFDMSEYSSQDSVSRFIGSSIGAENKGLSGKVHENPSSLILLDEFEKAHPKIHNLFLQVLDDGRLTDNNGKTVSFANAIIVATSNAGAEFIRKKIEEGGNIDKLFKDQFLGYLLRENIFRPELLNRFDDIVLFKPLGNEEVYKITKLMLIDLSKRLLEKDITIGFDEKIIAKITSEGFDQQFGARPLRRFIQDNIEDQIAQKILKEEIKRGDKVNVSVDEANNLQLTVNN